MPSMEANAAAGGNALDNSNTALAALLDDKTKTAGELMAAMALENGRGSLAQGFLTKNKDDNKFIKNLA